MKKQLALGIAGASAALVGGWRLINQLVNRGGGETDGVAVSPGMPAEEFTAPGSTGTVPGRPKPSPDASPAPSPATVSAKSSKAELYEVAQELDIDGRSKMTKDELLKAIQRAG